MESLARGDQGRRNRPPGCRGSRQGRRSRGCQRRRKEAEETTEKVRATGTHVVTRRDRRDAEDTAYHQRSQADTGAREGAPGQDVLLRTEQAAPNEEAAGAGEEGSCGTGSGNYEQRGDEDREGVEGAPGEEDREKEGGRETTFDRLVLWGVVVILTEVRSQSKNWKPYLYVRGTYICIQYCMYLCVT